MTDISKKNAERITRRLNDAHKALNDVRLNLERAKELLANGEDSYYEQVFKDLIGGINLINSPVSGLYWTWSGYAEARKEGN